jgi:IS30 family transposase
MGKNTKSIARYKLERARRKKVLELTEEGYTQTQIASQLGVSRKTVYRDLKRLRPYITRLINQHENAIQALWREKLAQYSTEQRFEILGDLMVARGNTRAMNRIFFAILSGEYKPKQRGF